jgi:hypothetical protein
MNKQKLVAAFDSLVYFFDIRWPDREIDRVAGLLPAHAEQDRSALDEFRVHFFHNAARFYPH